MRWLITGGCGFIGTNLIRRLTTTGGNQIRVVDNLSVGTRHDLACAAEYQEVHRAGLSRSGWSDVVQLIVGDILDAQLAADVANEADVIVHLAANTGVAPSVADPRSDGQINVLGTLNYLEAARRQAVRRFIFASSGAPVGEVDPPIREDVVPRPMSPYGASKLAGEGYCSAYFRTFGVETVVLRFGNVYGPGSYRKDSVIAKFFKQAIRGNALHVYGDGTQTRDFIYIDDLVVALQLAAASRHASGEIFQIATHSETALDDVAERVRALVEHDLGITVDVIHEQLRAGDVRRNFSDISKARKMLGYEPMYDLDKGLTATYEYFRARDTKSTSD